MLNFSGIFSSTKQLQLQEGVIKNNLNKNAKLTAANGFRDFPRPKSTVTLTQTK